MAEFKEAFKITLGHEGGYSDNVKDRGGETYKGVARNIWPDWPGWEIVNRIKRAWGMEGNLNQMLANNAELQEQVQRFYRDNFWRPAQLKQLDQAVANEIFDTGVNQGLGSAVKYLQKALNKLNRNGKDYPNIAEDGGLGPATLHAYTRLMATESFRHRSRERIIRILLKWMNYYQLERYERIVENNEEQECFIFGWTERA